MRRVASTSSATLEGVADANIATITALRDYVLLGRLRLPVGADDRLAKAADGPGFTDEVRLWLDAFRESLNLIDDFERKSRLATPSRRAYREVAEATTLMLDALVEAVTPGA